VGGEKSLIPGTICSLKHGKCLEVNFGFMSVTDEWFLWNMLDS
jgi:hypothetical protein